MISTNNDNEQEPIVDNTLFEGFTKDERMNFLAMNLALNYYKPVQGKDYQDFEKVNKRAKEIVKFIKKGDIK